MLHHLLDPDTLALKRFGEQAARVNAKLYAALFPDARPVAVYLELEEIARELLISDLARPDSVLHRALFTPRLREGLLGRLTGVRGCWSLCVASGGELSRTAGNGTAFFWGVDGRGGGTLCACRRTTARSNFRASICRLSGSRHRSPARPEHLSGAVRFLHDACT